jgi:hypothetical protein
MKLRGLLKDFLRNRNKSKPPIGLQSCIFKHGIAPEPGPFPTANLTGVIANRTCQLENGLDSHPERGRATFPRFTLYAAPSIHLAGVGVQGSRFSI